MHLLLTDRLTCPRCGPTFGLILLADELRERRVLAGRLGCANCREAYLISGGFGDLRPTPRGPLPAGEARGMEADTARAGQLLRLLGAGEGPGFTLTVGAAAVWAPALAAGLPEGAEVVAVDAMTRAWPETAGVSRITADERIPFFDRTVRGVLLDGTALDPAVLAECARVLARLHRVVILDPPHDATERLEAVGLGHAVAAPGVAAAGR